MYKIDILQLHVLQTQHYLYVRVRITKKRTCQFLSKKIIMKNEIYLLKEELETDWARSRDSTYQ